MASDGADGLASRLNEAAARLIAAVESVDGEPWRRVPEPRVWSIGREAEHVAEAGGYHQWIVRLTIGDKVSTRRPVLERLALTPEHSSAEVVAMIRDRTDEGARLIRSLSDEQLDLPTRPPRANGQRLAETIERVLIGHYDAHRMEIERKYAGKETTSAR
ncbi:MAG TPA: DinB family protein [Methylomirabilota bacterium]|jgi:uncharacterized damage-inducible protein DinB|nr:DinB family protein [Methylomirabilota bacterium]